MDTSNSHHSSDYRDDSALGMRRDLHRLQSAVTNATVQKTNQEHKVKNQAKKKRVAKLVPPALGQYWKGQGGIFVGTVYGEDGKSHYHLIVGPEMDGAAGWDKSMDWAKSLKVDGKKDFTLPNCRELRFMFCQAKHLHKDEWYWSGEQHASLSSFAWLQYFEHGSQGDWTKDNGHRARAVRRSPI